MRTLFITQTVAWLALSHFAPSANGDSPKPKAEHTICPVFNSLNSGVGASVLNQARSILPVGLIHITPVHAFNFKQPEFEGQTEQSTQPTDTRSCDYFVYVEGGAEEKSSFEKWMFSNEPVLYWTFELKLKKLPQAGELQRCTMTLYQRSPGGRPDSKDVSWKVVGAMQDLLEVAASKVIIAPWLDKPIQRTDASCR